MSNSYAQTEHNQDVTVHQQACEQQVCEESAADTNEFDQYMSPDLIEEAFPEPIVAAKPSRVQMQLMRFGMPVYFAISSLKQKICSFFTA